MFAFLGGTVGNLHPDERLRFFGAIRELMSDDDTLLLGTDLVKDVDELEAAYNDSEGVTAEFNRNALHALNRALDADFPPERFEHVAFFNDDESWIEMRLRSMDDRTIRLAGADMEIDLAAGEDIRTEISTKFTRGRVAGDLAEAGLRLDAFWTDDGDRFGVSLASPRP